MLTDELSQAELSRMRKNEDWIKKLGKNCIQGAQKNVEAGER